MAIDDDMEYLKYEVAETEEVNHRYTVLFRKCFGNMTLVSLLPPGGKERFYNGYTPFHRGVLLQEINTVIETERSQQQ